MVWSEFKNRIKNELMATLNKKKLIKNYNVGGKYKIKSESNDMAFHKF